MTAGVDLERRFSAWVVAEAPTHAPDRVLAGAMERVATTPQGRSVGRRVAWRFLLSASR